MPEKPFFRGTNPIACEPLIVVLMLICGTLARFVVGNSANSFSPIRGESHNVAVSLATTGRFADPFGYPSGPTAHLGMLTPLPSAFVYWLFGGDSPYAEFILYCWAAFLVFISIWLCWRLAVVLDAPRASPQSRSRRSRRCSSTWK